MPCPRFCVDMLETSIYMPTIPARRDGHGTRKNGRDGALWPGHPAARCPGSRLLGHRARAPRPLRAIGFVGGLLVLAWADADHLGSGLFLRVGIESLGAESLDGGRAGVREAGQGEPGTTPASGGGSQYQRQSPNQFSHGLRPCRSDQLLGADRAADYTPIGPSQIDEIREFRECRSVAKTRRYPHYGPIVWGLSRNVATGM